MEKAKRLLLNGVYNIRDLGGYIINSNSMTKWKVFVRSADLADMTTNDMDSLYDYGIRTIVNLKDYNETKNPVDIDKRFNYIQIPLINDFPRMFNIICNYNGSFYLTMIEAFQECIKQIFISFSEHINDGGILFHCISGKDRTGVIAAILLLMNDVSVLDIVADFTISAIYLRPVADRDNKPYEDILKYPQEIEQVIEHLNNKYDGAENYLKTIGVPLKDIEKIKTNFNLIKD